MKTLLIGCNTLKPEIEYVIKQTNQELECRWLNSGLHNVPVNLKTEVQKAIDQAVDEGYERIILGYAFCGNGIVGINSRSCELVLPRVDDCITFFLGSPSKRTAVPDGSGTYYLTRGWAFDKEHLWDDYDKYVEAYGEEMADELIEDLLGHYKQIGVINTHCYPLDEVIDVGRKMSVKFNLGKVVEIDSDHYYIDQLLNGPWDEKRFLIIPPETTIAKELLTMVYE